jgi:hypothetical protein
LAGISFQIVLGIKNSGVIFAEEGEIVIPKELDDSNGTSFIARDVLCERLPAGERRNREECNTHTRRSEEGDDQRRPIDNIHACSASRALLASFPP